MSTKRCLGHFAMMFAAGVMATACGSSSPNPTAPTSPGATVSAVVVTSASTSGASFQLTATARMSDGNARDVTGAATWESSNPVLATVSSTGRVTVVGNGELDVRATYQSVAGSMHLLVGTLPVVAVIVNGAPSSSSSPFQLTAIARSSDGSTKDVTRSATWQSSNSQLATVSSTGYVTVVGNGEVALGATYQAVVGSVHVIVSLPRTFTVSGVIAEVAPNARPIVGARVQIGVDHTFSDDRGAFAFAGIVAGRTIIEVSKDGYQTWADEIVIDHDTQQTVNLYPTPPKNTNGVSATARCNDGSWSWSQTRSDACMANRGVTYTVCPGPLCTP